MLSGHCFQNNQASLGDLMYLFFAFDIDRPLQSVYCLLKYLWHIYNWISKMRSQKTSFTLVAVLLVSALLGVYGHAVINHHSADEVCQVCILLKTATSAHVVFSLALFLVSQTVYAVVVPLFVVILPVSTPGRSPPIV